ncbi:NADPH:quinone reductase-like Zn-dependent oxidoreductase [Nonomuraea thailandensis]|uniref:NADPH:quinone reductase-like Zn-dependent oxidoreductase n=1 Tax=Nonomuraea thailandensis TaxID=1188745 RepID=A0A9X2GFV3_9ACTN|nr:NADP-dependent oxidoreductase [Nonomuraea thailandensis]MCP2353308.1 NADPH:quinone reductase-like Zn-dependent oxidoreductase [Nonomuraea thailandensis]
MRALRIDRFGGPEVVAVGELPAPEPSPDEVLVRVVASSLNPVDVKTRSGTIRGGVPALPMTLGWDLAGVVVSPGDSGLNVGERVIAMSAQLAAARGTWADLVALPARTLAAAPLNTSLVEAATLPLPGLIAAQTLEWLGISSGQRLLVTGAAGAVGGLAVQLARARGITVDALVSRPAQLEAVTDLGAQRAVTDIAELDRQHYDAVFDTCGAPAGETVSDGGRYATIASEHGDPPDLSHRGVTTTLHQVREDGTGLAELVKLVETGDLRLRLDSSFPIAEVRKAFERFETRGLTGKVALVF